MNKAMMIVASAVVAAATTWVSAAQAKGGGGHHGGGGGGGMKFSSAPSHNHRPQLRVFRRDTSVASSYKTDETRVKRIKPVIVPADKGPIVKYADGEGRAYDLGSKVWCDGNKRCWTGQYAWTFKDGAWFYGTSRWYEVGGVWKTDAAVAPTSVDCETIPAFAALKPTTEPQIAGRGGDDEGGQPKDVPAAAAPIKTVETSPAQPGAKPTECKKYFPSVGGMVSVPCEG